MTVLFILDTVLITLASTALSGTTLTCKLESRWQQLFIAKDGGTIQAIQDSLKCCGFRTVRDKAWPFPEKGVGAEACVKRFGWQNSCEGIWTAEGRSMLRMMIGVGVGLVAIKVSVTRVFRRHAINHFITQMRLSREYYAADISYTRSSSY